VFILIALFLMVMPASYATAQEFHALARVEVAQTGAWGYPSGDLDFHLKLTQAVPYSISTRNDPARLVLDFREVDWSDLPSSVLTSPENIVSLRSGLFQPGWSRLVIEFNTDMRVHKAEMVVGEQDGDALLKVRLTPGRTESVLTNDDWDLPQEPAFQPKTRQLGDRPLVVLLDPGHGGIDPGAEYSGFSEADLMLGFARELKEEMVLSGRFEVFLSRDEDHFVPLDTRVGQARRQNADILISLHADAITEGIATGATVYTLSDDASDRASAELAHRLDRNQLLAGVDLKEIDDEVAQILMDLARQETHPRSLRLGNHLVLGIRHEFGEVRRKPQLSAAFTVLKAPEIPSALIELGFMSNPADLANLNDGIWRKKMVLGIMRGIDDWAREDTAQAGLLRK
jgi:N-acetylmuramoyl-L-alanine amidase